MQTYFLLRRVQMMTMLPTCSIFQRENEEYQREIVLETDEEMDSDEENPFKLPSGTALPVRNTHVVSHGIDRVQAPKEILEHSLPQVCVLARHTLRGRSEYLA